MLRHCRVLNVPNQVWLFQHARCQASVLQSVGKMFQGARGGADKEHP